MYTGTTSTLMVLKTRTFVRPSCTAITWSSLRQRIPMKMLNRWSKNLWGRTTLKDYTDMILLVYVYITDCKKIFWYFILYDWFLISWKTGNFDYVLENVLTFKHLIFKWFPEPGDRGSVQRNDTFLFISLN